MLCVPFFIVMLGVDMLGDIYTDCHLFNVMLSVDMLASLCRASLCQVSLCQMPFFRLLWRR